MNTNLIEENKYDHLVIIGSGPVGMVAALYLKDYFNRITVLERQSKDNFLKKYGFTFPIVFSPSSIKILKKIGAWDTIKTERSEFYGVVIHKRILGIEFRVKSYEENVYSHWRNHIIFSLYERILQENIEIHFDSKVENIDFENSICKEATLGNLPFNLLLGTDGINSQTRDLLAKAHPDFSEKDFGLTLLDKWYAYRLPAKGKMKEKYGGGDRFYASNVYVDNLPKYPTEKYRVVTTSMKQPGEEISVLVKHGANLELDRVRELNQVFFEDYVSSPQELESAWEDGYAGKFEQVTAPTFNYQNVLLLGDAAHGFESTGDLINLGLASIESFYKIFIKNQNIKKSLIEYDETVGESLRYYALFSLRRSEEKIGFEIASIELGAKLGITNRHPSLFGIFVDDFDIQNYMELYKGDIFKGRLLVSGIILILAILTSLLLT